MAVDSPTSRELDAFRDEADRFIAELDEEYYLHLAGHKETLELEPIYERHEHLRAGHRRAAVRRPVRPGDVVVPPPPVLADDLLKGALEVIDEDRVDLLVDRDRRGRVRDVDEDGGAALARHRAAHAIRDVDQLRLALALQAQLVHGRLS